MKVGLHVIIQLPNEMPATTYKLWYTTLIHLGIMWQVLNIEFDPVE